MFATLLVAILTVYTLVWTAINVYNLFPLLKYSLRRRVGGSSSSIHKLPSKLLRISILLPAYHEEYMLPYSIKRIFESDYPSELLDVIVLTEKDDNSTIEVVKKLVQEYGINHISVEENREPRGKPRALNLGLMHARGEIIGVLDAEDIIDKKLFLKVVTLMESGYDAVQGVLDMVNDRDGFTNMHLRAEYRYWYRIYLPALVDSNFPVPLGGTTNFFKRDTINELKGWDPYNVTEDFDLGVRLYNEHKRIGIAVDMLGRRPGERIFHNKYEFSMLRSTTKEESPTTLHGWLKQRTRWQRGKIQTFKKIFKDPPDLAGNLFHSIMMSLIPHMGPINITGITYSVLMLFSGLALPLWLWMFFTFNIAMVVFYCIMQGYGFFTSVHKNRRNRLPKAVFVAVSTPAYWLLQWVADIRAMKHEYLGTKIFWEKTSHSGAHIKKAG